MSFLLLMKNVGGKEGGYSENASIVADAAPEPKTLRQESAIETERPIKIPL